MQQGAGLEQSNERTGDFPVWLRQDPWEGARWPCRRAGGWVGVSLPCRDLWGLGLVRSSTGTSRRHRTEQEGTRQAAAEFGKAALACCIRLNRHRRPPL